MAKPPIQDKRYVWPGWRGPSAGYTRPDITSGSLGYASSSFAMPASGAAALRPNIRVTGRIDTSSSALARKTITASESKVTPVMLDILKTQAKLITETLKRTTAAAYQLASTGRVARGWRWQVIKSHSSSVTMRIHNLNYREMQYITNVGGGGHFKAFPVGKYDITAKPGSRLRVPRREGAWELISGSRSRVQRAELRFVQKVLGRSGRYQAKGKILKRWNYKPQSGYISYFPGGDKRRRELLAPREYGTTGEYEAAMAEQHKPLIERKGDLLSTAFVYPQVVSHPGFEFDVISATIQQGVEQTVAQLRNRVYTVWRPGGTGGSPLGASIKVSPKPGG